MSEWEVEDLLVNEHFKTLCRSQLNRAIALYRSQVFREGGIKYWMRVHWRAEALREIKRILKLMTVSMLSISEKEGVD